VAAAVVLVLGGGLAFAHGPSQAGPALLLSPTATSPSPSPSDTIPPLTVASGAPQGWSDEPVTVTLKANDNTGGSGVASISYSIDGGAIVIVPGATALVAFAAPADHAGDGVHTLSFYATDLAGNVEAAQTLQVSIATRPPRLVWRGLAPALVRRTEPLRLRFVLGDETGSPHAGRRVALTFDDGYDKAGWAAVLAALHAAHVHATPFVNGRYVVGYPTLARRTIAWGEVVGSHTWSHILTTTETPAQIKAQIEGDVDAWWRVARATPVPYFRPPYGGYDSTTLAMAGSLGFARVMLWSVDPSDYTQPGAGVIVARVLAAVRPGAIVELHLLPQTAAALPNLIAGLRARGYSLVTLPQLFRAAGDS
jgi:peptidoglycan/xylan/chitin deacetylase (PgdA/CDA1 family)